MDSSEYTKPDEMKHWAIFSGSADEPVVSVNVRDIHTLEIGEPDWGLESRSDMDIGNDRAPSPADYLNVGVAGCQVEVIRQCLEKARVEQYEITAMVENDVVDPGETPDVMPSHMSARIQSLDIEITVKTTEEYESRVRRCVDVAEKACIVGRSVEDGIDVPVSKQVTIEST